uniref:hypothetical protein n=1 Tax=Trichocoleus desertorum TaxID=1481672 RepID=UPI0025B47A07|nr:hypothetical protein [Trichocoleus desertorum]
MKPPVLLAFPPTATPQSGLNNHPFRKHQPLQFAIAGLISLGLGFSLLNAPNVTAQSLSQTVSSATKSTQGTPMDTGRGQQGQSKGLPRSVSEAVLQDATHNWGLPLNTGKIVGAKSVRWAYGCDRPTFPYPCDPVLVKGWQVAVESTTQRWFYYSNMNGSLVQLHRREVKSTDLKLPANVNNAVVQLAAAHFSLPHSQVLITQVQKQTWKDACLELPSSVERCMGTPTLGWRVTVVGKPGQIQVYRTDSKGQQIRTEAIAGLPPRWDELPTATARLLLQNASARLRVPTSQLYILRAEKQRWSNYCLGLPKTNANCLEANLAGWRVTLDGAGHSLVYRVDDAVSQIRIEPTSISHT